MHIIRHTSILALALLNTLQATANQQPLARSAQQPQSQIATVYVRKGSNLCNAELAAYKARMAKASATLGALTHQTLSPTQTPVVGLVCSGGGLRASIATIGMLRGLEKIGVLDAVAYSATLSGSTWSMSSWLFHQMSVNALTTYLKEKTLNTFGSDNIDERGICSTLLSKIKRRRSLNLIDLWGALIANIFLGINGSNGQEAYLADIIPQASNGKYPIPLFTAIMGDTTPNYQWAEFSPFESGSCYLNTWVPTRALGKKFNNGVSIDSEREERYGYLLGIFGSAFAVDFRDIIQAFKESIEASYEMNFSSYFSWITGTKDLRLVSPKINNFAFQLPRCPFNTQEKLTFIDAGLAINIPFPPLLRRNVNVYFVCDASSDAASTIGTDMREVETYAQKNGYLFPHINYAELATKELSIWSDATNPQTPIIIHIPNFNCFSTTKASYTAQEFDALSGGIENAIINNAQQIYQALKQAVSNKKGA